MAASLVAQRADAVVTVSDAISQEMRDARRGAGRDDPERLRLRRLRGARVPPGRTLPDHAHGHVLRPPRPEAVPLRARRRPRATSWPASSAGSARPIASSQQELGLGDRVEEIPHVPRRSALELQRDSEALLLLLPEAGGRGRTVPSGKIFEYLAAERPILAAVPPDGVAAELVRRADAGVVVAPDDVAALHGGDRGPPRALEDGRARRTEASREELKERLSRRTRSGEFAELLGSFRERPGIATDVAELSGAASIDVLLPGDDLLGLVPERLLGRRGAREPRRRARAALPRRLRRGPHHRPRPARAARRRSPCSASPSPCSSSTSPASSTSRRSQALSLYGKGLTKFLIHFAFLAAGVAYLARRSERFYWQTLGWFAAGFAANAAYGLLQLVARLGGRNLDALVLNPITGGAASLNIWGAVGESSVYRVNGLTGDANHLGRDARRPAAAPDAALPAARARPPAARSRSPSCSASCCSSRSRRSRGAGCSGLVVGGAVLAVVYRPLLVSRALLVPLGAVAAVLARDRHAAARLLLERAPRAAADERHVARRCTSRSTTSSRRRSMRTRCSGSG